MKLRKNTFHLLVEKTELLDQLVTRLQESSSTIGPCLSCGNLSEGDQCTLSVGKYNLEYVTGNINVEIRATDQNGNGLTTVISQFDLRLVE